MVESNKDMQYLDNYDSSIYKKPSVTVDLIILTIFENKLMVYLVNRDQSPFINMLALPGSFVSIDETLEEAVERCLERKVGLKNIYFEQLFTWGDVKRDPRMRIISVSYLALVSFEMLNKSLGEQGINGHLFSVEEILSKRINLAFDHGEIIKYARERVTNKVEYSPIAFELLPDKFTLPQLQRINEILLGKDLYKANFRKKIIDQVIETNEFTSGENHRPSKLYVRRMN